MRPRVLVVGGSNQISACLVPRLLAAGKTVCVLSRRAQPDWIAPHPQLDWQVQNPARTPVAQETETLYYLAPLALFEQLASVVPQCGRVVVFSSTSLLSKADSANDRERAVARELDAGENLVRQISSAASTPWTLLRPTLVYGVGLDRNLTRIAAGIRRWRLFPLVGEGTGLRQPVHAEDLAASAMAAGKSQAAANQAYELAGGSTIRYQEMIVRVFESLSLPARFVRVPSWAITPSVKLATRLPRWRDLTPQMLQRMNVDLVFDDRAARRDFGHDPRPFHPDPASWSPPGRLPDCA